MPRGVYDRSKTKAAKPTAEKTEKKARAPWGSKTKAAKATTQSFSGGEELSITQLSNLRDHFATPVNTNIISKIDTLVAKKLDLILASYNQPAVEVKATKAAQSVTAPVAAAPTQAVFNPAVPANGQA